jgi:KDO2-lipid IV(A) lauroyltransferase
MMAWQHRAEDLLIRGVEVTVRWLPESWALALGTLLGTVVGDVLRIRRRVVVANLRRAFPERDTRWIKQVASGFYRHLGSEGVILLRLGGMSPEEILARTQVEGLEHITKPLSNGQGVIILSGHLGNWEMGGAAMAVRGIPMDGVAKRQNNPRFNERINRMRERNGMRVVERSEANTRLLLKSLRMGRAVVLVADQNVRQGGLFVDFFGIPASTARGPELLAQRTGAAVVFTAAIREPGSPARYRLRVHPLATDVEAGVLRLYLALLEDEIRAAPTQYLWAHKRWKTRPPPAELAVDSERGAPSTVPQQEHPLT